MHITNDQIQQYFQDGAVLIKNAFSEDWVGKVKEGIEVSWNYMLGDKFAINEIFF